MNCQAGVKSYTCGKCNFAAVHKEAMAWHMTKVHNERIKCPHCNYLALHQWSIKVHVKTKHTNERDFKCEHCDQGGDSIIESTRSDSQVKSYSTVVIFVFKIVTNI